VGEKDTIVQIVGKPDGGVVELYQNPVVKYHSSDHRPFPPNRTEALKLVQDIDQFIAAVRVRTGSE
jgi:hypothetical protein